MKTFCGIFMALVLVLGAAGVTAAAPGATTFTAVLSGECAEAESDWRGVAVFRVADGEVHYKVIANNIDEPLIAGHIHVLPSGGIVQDLNVEAPANADGIVAEGTFENAALVAAILADPDDYYVNLHTETCFIPGAVRGPLRVPTSSG